MLFGLRPGKSMHGKRRKNLYDFKVETRMKLFAPLKKQYGAACVVFSTKICHQRLGLMDGRRHCVNGSKSSVYFDSCHISIYLHRIVQSSRQVRIHQHWQQSSGQIEHSGAAGHLVNTTTHFTDNNSMISVRDTPFCVFGVCVETFTGSESNFALIVGFMETVKPTPNLWD